MTVKIAIFRAPADRRAWRYQQVTKSQKDRLFKLFGARVRITRHVATPYGDMFEVHGTQVWLTPRGRVMSEKPEGED